MSKISMAASVLVVLAIGSSACTKPIFKPDAIPQGEGALFGRIELLNHGEPIAGKCKVDFASTHDGDTETIHVPVDGAGWVFTAVKTGPIQLSALGCILYRRIVGANQATYFAHNLRIDVPGGDKITYFGHVRIDLSTQISEKEQKEYDALPGIPRRSTPWPQSEVIIPNHWGERPESLGENGIAEVDSHLEEARLEYEQRYGKQQRALKIKVSLAGGGPPASTDPPATAVGFAFDKDIDAAEARCTGADLVWKGLDDGRFSCSGAPIDLGLPVKVTLTACAEAVCDIAMNASFDGAEWRTLMKRFSSLTHVLEGIHGSKHLSSMTPVDDCADGPKRCFEAGRFRKSVIWKWEKIDLRKVALVLDAGPQGGVPSLVVTYHVAAAAEKK